MVPVDGNCLNDEAREGLERALKFIDYRPRSSGETTDRLRRCGYSGATIRVVIKYLEACGLLDDREFARVYLGEMLRKGYGYHRVRDELLKKRLNRELVDDMMEDYPIDEEIDRAVKIASRLSKRIVADDPSKLSRKMVGYMMRKGYSRQIAVEAYRLTHDVDTKIGRE